MVTRVSAVLRCVARSTPACAPRHTCIPTARATIRARGAQASFSRPERSMGSAVHHRSSRHRAAHKVGIEAVRGPKIQATTLWEHPFADKISQEAEGLGFHVARSARDAHAMIEQSKRGSLENRRSLTDPHNTAMGLCIHKVESHEGREAEGNALRRSFEYNSPDDHIHLLIAGKDIRKDEPSENNVGSHLAYYCAADSDKRVVKAVKITNEGEILAHQKKSLLAKAGIYLDTYKKHIEATTPDHVIEGRELHRRALEESGYGFAID